MAKTGSVSSRDELQVLVPFILDDGDTFLVKVFNEKQAAALQQQHKQKE